VALAEDLSRSIALLLPLALRGVGVGLAAFVLSAGVLDRAGALGMERGEQPGVLVS
jgi:hypothetical protein